MNSLLRKLTNPVNAFVEKLPAKIKLPALGDEFKRAHPNAKPTAVSAPASASTSACCNCWPASRPPSPRPPSRPTRPAATAPPPSDTALSPIPVPRPDRTRFDRLLSRVPEGDPDDRPEHLLLNASLKQHKLPTMLAEHDKLAREAATRDEPYHAYLLRLTELEVAARTANAVAARIRAAGFPVHEEFDTIDFTALPSLPKQKVLELARREWVDQLESRFQRPEGRVGEGRRERRPANATAGWELSPEVVPSHEDVLPHATLHVGQALVTALVEVRRFLVGEPQ